MPGIPGMAAVNHGMTIAGCFSRDCLARKLSKLVKLSKPSKLCRRGMHGVGKQISIFISISSCLNVDTG